MSGALAASPQPLALRSYQLDAVERIRAAFASGRRRVLFVLATGGGKTVCFSYIVAGAVRRGRRALVLGHRQEILDQIEGALSLAGVPFGIIAPGHVETDSPVQIASIATLARRLNRWRDRFDFAVVDECHHAVAGSWAAVLASQPRAHVLGVSATPQRLDGRGLREQFDEIVIGPSTAELIEARWLSPFVVYEPTSAPDLSAARMRGGDFAVEDLRAAMDGVVIGAAVAEYQRLCPGAPAVAFCVDVAHSQAVAAAFRDHGVKAAHVAGDTPAAERRAAIAALGNGGLDVLCNCQLFTEGVDIPTIAAAVLLRPTASVTLFLQMVGRTLRPAPGKARAVILDFAGNVARHGLPDDARAWSLDAKRRRQRERAEGSGLRRCAACAALNRPSAQSCVECGGDLKTPRERREVEVALQEAKRRELEDALARMSKFERLAWAGADEDRLRLVARVSGYRPGWIYFRRRELAELRLIAGGVQ